MDQGIAATPSGRALRLVLMFFAAVLGLLVLSFVFGSSSASADDGDSLGSTLGGVVSEATKPVKQVTHSVRWRSPHPRLLTPRYQLVSFRR